MFLLSQEYWKIKKTRKKGRGVFATNTIAKGTVIGDYIGKIIRPSEEDVYEKGDDFFLMYYHQNATLYPNTKAPGIHIINHSCEPNCGIYTYKGHTLYFAIRKIFKGEELTVSYMVSPLDTDCNPCTHRCYCESALCTKTMHLSEKDYAVWTAYDDNIAKKTKRQRVRFGKDLPLLSSYPKKISDYSSYPLFSFQKN